MKKLPMLLLLTLLLFNCKEDKTEKRIKDEQKLSISERMDEKKQKLKKDLILALKEDNLTRQKFKIDVFPLLTKFVEIDKEKYSILNKIGEKMSKEINDEAFTLSKENLIKELKK